MGYSNIPKASVIPNTSLVVAENAYRILQSNNTFVNGKNIFCDEFVDSDGTNNTANTSSTDAVYDAANTKYLGAQKVSASDTTYNVGVSANLANFFDDNTSTNATYAGDNRTSLTSTLGKTFTEKLVKDVRIKAQGNVTNSGYWRGAKIELLTYNGSSWSVAATLYNDLGSSSPGGTYDDTYSLNATCQGVAVRITTNSSASGSAIDHSNIFYVLNYNYGQDAVVVCDSNTLSLTGTETDAVVFVDGSYSDGDITYDLTDGATTITGCAINENVDISALATGNVTITFNLTNAATCLGYSTIVIRSD